MEFKKYRRSQVAELRPYQEGEELLGWVTISSIDKENGSPKIGDMIARNPKDHTDQWLITERYFKDNFEEAKEYNQPQLQGNSPITFLDRLVLEEQQLGEKITALNKGLSSDGFAEKVGDYQFELLNLQLSTMTAYRRVLTMRIKDLKGKH